jgi:hypothetical protein
LVLFEMLAGRNPFQQRSVAETMLSIQQGIASHIGLLGPSCPDALANLFGEVLAGSSGQRPSSAREFRTRLQGVALQAD